MKALVGAFNQEEALVGAFSVIVQLHRLIVYSTNPRSEAAAEVTAAAARISLRDIRHFPASFWLLCLATLTYYGSIFPFVSLAQSFFRTEFSFEEEAANFLVGLVYLVSAVASPALGWLLDRTGRQVDTLEYLSPYLQICNRAVNEPSRKSQCPEKAPTKAFSFFHN